MEKFGVLVSGVTLPRPETDRTPVLVHLDYEELCLAAGDDTYLSLWHLPSPGSTTVAVLFHGFGAEKSALLDEAAMLNREGCSVVMVDFRGSGGSTGTTTTIGMREAEDVQAVYQLVRDRWPDKKTLLFGHSMGAVAIFRAVSHYHLEPDYIIAEAIFDTMLNAVRNRFRVMNLPLFPGPQLLVFWGGRQIGQNGFRHNPVNYAQDIHSPVLFIHGADDSRATVAQAQRVFSQVPGVKQFVEFPDNGHGSCLSSRPDLWQGSVRSFLAQ